MNKVDRDTLNRSFDEVIDSVIDFIKQKSGKIRPIKSVGSPEPFIYCILTETLNKESIVFVVMPNKLLAVLEDSIGERDEETPISEFVNNIMNM